MLILAGKSQHLLHFPPNHAAVDLHHRNGSRRPLRRATGHDRVLSPSLLASQAPRRGSDSSVHLHLEMKQPSNSGEHRTDLIPRKQARQKEKMCNRPLCSLKPPGSRQVHISFLLPAQPYAHHPPILQNCEPANGPPRDGRLGFTRLGPWRNPTLVNSCRATRNGGTVPWIT